MAKKYSRIAELRADVDTLLADFLVQKFNAVQFQARRNKITVAALKKLKGAGFAPAWATQLLRLYEEWL